MSAHDAFYDAILAEPAADVHRLVYADWLDETGDPANAARAEYIRLQCECSVSERAAELFREHWIDWWRPVCQRLGLPEPSTEPRTMLGRWRRAINRRPVGWPYHPQTEYGHAGQTYFGVDRVYRHYGPAASGALQNFVAATFHRGFVESLDLTGPPGGPTLTDWLSVVPARDLRLLTRSVAEFAADDTPALRHLRRLAILLTDATQAATVLWSSHLTALESLGLESQDEAGVSGGEVADVLAAPAAARLHDLTIQTINPSGAAALCDLGRLPNFRSLSLMGEAAAGRVGDATVIHTVAALPIRERLEALLLSSSSKLLHLPAGMAELCARSWPRLRELTLWYCMRSEQVAVLTGSGAFPTLESLTIDLLDADVDAALGHLARWPQLRRLKRLYLSVEVLPRPEANLVASATLVALADGFDLAVLQSVVLPGWLHGSAEELLRPRLGRKLGLLDLFPGRFSP